MARRIAYLMSHYPAVSHTFVMREVEALRAAGIDVQTLSIHRVAPEHLLAQADRTEAASTFAVLPIGAGGLLAVHMAMCARSPRRYLSTLGLALKSSAPGLRDRLWHLFYFAEAMVLAQHCRRAGIDHIHAIFADSATDVAMLVSHYERRGDTSDVSWSLAVHGSVEFYNVARYGIAEKLARARFAVAISDFGRSQLMTLSPPERWPHIHVIRCGLQPGVFQPPAARSNGTDSTEILFVGRLLPGKGLALLFKSLATLRAEGRDVRLTIIGDGPARGDLEASVRAEGVSEVVSFLGAVGQDEIRDYFARADIFCLPSFAEGIPVVVMEAMAMELPVVTTRIMGIPELVVDGEHGRLVAPGRVDALTDALRDLIRSPELRLRMGRAGRAKVISEYDVANSARRLRTALEDELELA